MAQDMAQKKSLRIAMLGHKRIPSREGGVEVVVEELSTRFARDGHSVTCFNRRGHHVSGRDFDADIPDVYKGVRLVNVFTVNRRGLAALTSSLSGTLRAAFGPYDVVHIHAEGPAFLCWLPRLLGKRVVVTVHGLDHMRAKWGRLATAYIRMGEHAAVRHAHSIIVLSESVRRYFLETYGRKTVLIPNGASPALPRPAEEIARTYGLGTDGYILFLGRLVPEKGLLYLLRAFRDVKTDKRLVIAGGSSDTDDFVGQIEALARQDDRVLLTGFVQGRTLEELYSNAYVYCLPSDLEGMPLSLLEAMSYGCCCLTSDIPECAAVVGDHAVTFRRGDTDDLRDRLQWLCDDASAVRRYRAGAAAYITEKYKWDDVADRTLAVYRGQTPPEGTA